MNKPIFILGLGAQKSGTTWLFKLLNTQNFSNFGIKKEYHVWDAKFDKDIGYDFVIKKSLFKRQNKIEKILWKMQNKEGFYGEYFKSLIKKNIFLTGDITPSYSSLNFKQISHIKKIIDDNGFDLKVIYIMRDPVERFISAMSMMKRNQKSKGINISSQKLIDNSFKKIILPRFTKRSDYKSTLEVISQVFKKEQVFFEFYERLFKKKTINRLSKFIGFKLENISFSEKENDSEKIIYPEEIKDKLKFYFKETYEYCNSKFPETKKLWRK